MDTLTPNSNGPLCTNTVIGTLAVDGWAVTFGTVRRALALGCGPAGPLLAVPNVAHQWPVYQLYIIRCGTIITFAF